MYIPGGSNYIKISIFLTQQIGVNFCLHNATLANQTAGLIRKMFGNGNVKLSVETDHLDGVT